MLRYLFHIFCAAGEASRYALSCFLFGVSGPCFQSGMHVALIKILGAVMAKLEEIFGVTSQALLSYVERPQVDDSFREALEARKQIIV